MAHIPEHVTDAFHSAHGKNESAQQMGYAWDNGYKLGDVVYSQAAPTASWSAKVREKLTVEGARVARPVLSTDGRYVVGGWKATQFVPGQLASRVDETVLLATRLERALEGAPLPPIDRDDVFAAAERAAWEETGEALEPISQDGGLVMAHADLLACTIYQGANPPAIVDMVPSATRRPRGYTAALVMVDGLIAGAVDDAICDRFSYLPNGDQLLLRAVAYRRHVNTLHPESKVATRSAIARVEDMLIGRVTATM